jgi:hypothetical protein
MQGHQRLDWKVVARAGLPSGALGMFWSKPHCYHWCWYTLCLLPPRPCSCHPLSFTLKPFSSQNLLEEVPPNTIVSYFKIYSEDHPDMFFLLIPCTISYKITTPSTIYLPVVKAVWLGLSKVDTKLVSLSIISRVKILKLTLSRQIGRNCLTLLASFTFETNVITPIVKSSNIKVL